MPTPDRPHDERVEVRLYGDLDWFCSEVNRHGVVDVPLGERRSVKDLIESLGIPHVEVGAVLIDGTSVGFDTLVSSVARVAVYPPLRDLAPLPRVWPDPPDPRRFVADVHLGTLARLLRLLGFDTWYATDADDADLAQRAVEEERVLLTRDRQLLMRRVIVHGYCPRSSDPDEQLTELVTRYDLAGHARPFTRCAECNARLAAVPKADVLDELPPRTRIEHDTFSRCTGCGRVYWAGSHIDAIARRFDAILGPAEDHG